MADFAPQPERKQELRLDRDAPVSEQQEFRAAIEKIRASETFRNSERLLAFLDFVLDAKLKGDESDLKETRIGVGLYGREPTYDTKLDSIVRTQARRVRERLDEYYRAEGALDPFRISIPKGGYAPLLERHAISEPPSSPVGGEPAQRPAFSRLTLWLIAGGLVVLFGTWVVHRWGESLRPAPGRVSYRQLTRDGKPKWLIGTDGARLYLGMGNYASPALGSVSVDGGDPVSIPLPSPGLLPLDVSADGSRILLADYYPGRFWSLSVSDGTLRRLGAASGGAASWSPDGTRLAYCRDEDLWVSDSEGMGSRRIATIPGSRRMYAPSWSPDGKRIRFTLWEKVPDSPSLWEVSVDGKGLRALLHSWHDPSEEEDGRWTSDGKYFVFQSKSQIWALPDRPRAASGRAKPLQLTNTPLNLLTPVPARHGSGIFVVGRSLRGELVRYSGKSGAFTPLMSGMSADYVNFSYDGEWVAYVAYPEGSLWRSRKDGSERMRLTDLPLHPTLPRWSPDGKSIAFFDKTRGKPFRSFIVSAAGGVPQLLCPEEPDLLAEPFWFPGGKKIALSVDRPRGASEIRMLDLVSGNVSTLAGSQGTYGPVISPDGRFLVAVRKEPISLTIYDFQTQTWSELARVTGGFPSWSRDGKFVYYLRFPDNAAVIRIHVADRRVEVVADLGRISLTGHMGSWLGLAPDDSPLLLRDAGTQDVYALDWEAP